MHKGKEDYRLRFKSYGTYSCCSEDSFGKDYIYEMETNKEYELSLSLF